MIPVNGMICGSRLSSYAWFAGVGRWMDVCVRD